MKKWKKLGKLFGIVIIVLLLTYISIYVVAKLMPKLPINSANSFYLFDNSCYVAYFMYIHFIICIVSSYLAIFPHSV